MDSNVNKISSVISYFGSEAALNLNVVLTDIPKDMAKYRELSYHRETDFYSKKADKRMINIRLSFRYFLSIEGFKSLPSEDRPYIIINGGDIPMIRKRFHEYYDTIFCDPNVFIEENGNITGIRKGKKPILIDNLPFGKYLVLAPELGENSFDETHYKATRLHLSSKGIFIILNESQFLDIMYAFDSINLYQSSLELINYYSRPPDGTNRFLVKY